MPLRRETSYLSPREEEPPAAAHSALPMFDPASPSLSSSTTTTNTTLYERRKRRSSSIDSIDEAFFLRPYVPLSNLPTPPLCSKSSSRNTSPEPLFADFLDPELLGPAVHFHNLIPVTTTTTSSSTVTSLTRTSIPLIQSILTRAALPVETIALAICILESFLLAPPSSPPSICTTPSKFPRLADEEEDEASAHVEDDKPLHHLLQPELIILSTLILAVKFLNDVEEPTVVYRREWTLDLWTCAEINHAQNCILEGIGWRIMPLWVEEKITHAMSGMKLAGLLHEPEIWDGEMGRGVGVGVGSDLDLGLREELGAGLKLLGLGDQLTPADTPVLEGHAELIKGKPCETTGVSGYFDANVGLKRLCLS